MFRDKIFRRSFIFHVITFAVTRKKFDQWFFNIFDYFSDFWKFFNHAIFCRIKKQWNFHTRLKKGDVLSHPNIYIYVYVEIMNNGFMNKRKRNINMQKLQSMRCKYFFYFNLYTVYLFVTNKLNINKKFIKEFYLYLGCFFFNFIYDVSSYRKMLNIFFLLTCTLKRKELTKCNCIVDKQFICYSETQVI